VDANGPQAPCARLRAQARQSTAGHRPRDGPWLGLPRLPGADCAPW